jgi:spore coat protein U-like protein
MGRRHGRNGDQSYSAGATIFTVYGTIPKGQYVVTGAYTDTITVSVIY